MSSKAAGMSHDEIWDDSMLIDSWNQALEEYKKYHSIHAKGGKTRELAAIGQDSSRNATLPGVQSAALDDQPVETVAEQETGLAEDGSMGNQESSTIKTEPGLDHGQSATSPRFSPPQAVLGSVRDENLKKLLMSWYYAGYYTGLYEGQQQAQL